MRQIYQGVNLWCLRERKIAGRESSRKSFAKEPQKTCAAKVHSPTQHVRRESAADEQMRITPLFSGLWHVVAICGHTIHRSFAHKRSRPFTLSELNLDDNLEEDLVGSWQNLDVEIEVGTSDKSLLSRYVFVGSWPDIC